MPQPPHDLSHEDDPNHFSSVVCHKRKYCVKLVAAKQDFSRANQGLIKKGRIGLRSQCGCEIPFERFPTKLENLQDNFTKVCIHWKQCSKVLKADREAIKKVGLNNVIKRPLKGGISSKKYWVQAAKKIRLVQGIGGIYFAEDNAESSSDASSDDESSCVSSSDDDDDESRSSSESGEDDTSSNCDDDESSCVSSSESSSEEDNSSVSSSDASSNGDDDDESSCVSSSSFTGSKSEQGKCSMTCVYPKSNFGLYEGEDDNEDNDNNLDNVGNSIDAYSMKGESSSSGDDSDACSIFTQEFQEDRRDETNYLDGDDDMSFSNRTLGTTPAEVSVDLPSTIMTSSPENNGDNEKFSPPSSSSSSELAVKDATNSECDVDSKSDGSSRTFAACSTTEYCVGAVVTQDSPSSSKQDSNDDDDTDSNVIITKKRKSDDLPGTAPKKTCSSADVALRQTKKKKRMHLSSDKTYPVQLESSTALSTITMSLTESNETASWNRRSNDEVVNTNDKGSDDEVAKASQSKSSDSSANSQSSSDKTYVAPPDKQSNVKDKLECCQFVLHPCFKKNELSKSKSMSNRVGRLEDNIKEFMTKSIKTGRTEDGMTLPSPGFMYICGGPGTGKTTAVTSCAGDMKKWAKRNGYDKPKFCFINMASSQTSASNCKNGIMRTMLKKIATSIEVDKQAKLSVFEKKFKKQVLILILDEVDMLFKEHGETWFRTLVEWAKNDEMRFSMIGISNCVNDDNAIRIRDIGSPRELVFAAYNEADILAILEQRLGKNIVEHKALQLISKRVAASSGDARHALEITSNAVSKCVDLLRRDDKLDIIVDRDDECMPLVKLTHMMRAIREAMPMRHNDVIAGLPQAAKVVLCIAVSLSQVWGPTAEISVSTLKRYCIEATHHAIMDELGVDHILSLVEMLMDSGLLLVGNTSQFNSCENPKLRIGVQLDDVQIALEQSLLKEGGFYKSLVDYVKRECPSPS